MDVARLGELLGLAIAERRTVEVVDGGRTIRIECDPSGAGSKTPASPPAGRTFTPAGAGTIVAPCFGIVHLAPTPGAPPFASVGDPIAEGQRVCLVEAMKVFNAVAAPAPGRIAEVLVTSGAEVERGQPLFRVEPTAGSG